MMLTMCFAFAGCGGEESSSTGSADTSGTTSSDTNDSSSGEETNAYEDIKIGFIFLHDENSTYDKNFIDAANEMKEALGFPTIRFSW